MVTDYCPGIRGVRPLLAQLRVELTLASRRAENLLVTLVVPLALLVFFAAVLPPRVVGGRPLDFLVPGILALAVVSTGMVSLGIATAYERYYGALKRLIGSPLPRGSLLLAKALSVLAVEAIQVVLVLGVARVAFGWAPAGSLPLALGVLLVGSSAFAGLGLLMAGTLRAEGTLALANGLYLVSLLLGGFVFPLDGLPAPLAAIARLLPAATLADATRAALNGPLAAVWPPLLLLSGWALAAGLLAARSFRPE